jgi:hypothetical protein
MVTDLPDYSKKVIVVYEGTIIGGEVLVDHRKILGIALKTPTFAKCIPTSIENDAIAYDAVNDRFKIVLEAITAGVIPVSLTAIPNPPNLDVALSTRATGTLLNPHPVSLSTLLNPHPVSLSTLLNPHPVSLSTLLNPHPVSLASIPNPSNLDVALSLIKAKTDNLDVALSLIKAKTDNLDVLLSTRFKPTDSIGNTSFAATQTTRTSLLMKPEREDGISLGGVASPNNAGVQLIPPSGQTKVKVFDAGFCGAVAGVHYFYFGTSTAATTRRFCTINIAGVMHQTFVQPRVSNAADGLYLFSSVSETNMPYDLNYVQEA